MRLDQLVSPWAKSSPHQVAVDGNEVFTYAELDQLANCFANLILASGLQLGDRVGIHLPRSGRAIAAMLGTVRAGGIYVPLDPGSPPARMQLIVRDCGLRHVVIAPHLLDSWIAASVCEPVEHYFLSEGTNSPELPQPCRVHLWSEVVESSPTLRGSPDESPDDLAYILYTSGSTGVPKGVMISHRNALGFVNWAAEQISLGQTDRVASVAPFHFDLSVFDIWASLSRGATIVIVDEVTVISGSRMLDRIHEKSINVWYSVPSALVLMLENGALAERGAASLRVVFFAGEVFPIKYLRRAMTAIFNARFFNLFGPTETNVCLAYEVKSPPPADAKGIPIGTASCGDIISILDTEGHAVADGEVGELFVDGPTVMLGYWDAGRRTLAQHPYGTGDLVSRHDDGQLMYHGRRDHMVKVHGYRVELGEVETALNGHPGIQEALAFAVDQQLVAVAVPAAPSLSVLDVKRYCATRLPKYMIPTDIRLVERLPRTSSGKADRVRTRTAVLESDVSTLKPIRPAQL